MKLVFFAFAENSGFREFSCLVILVILPRIWKIAAFFKVTVIAMRTNLLPSDSLITLAEAICQSLSQTKFGDLKSQKHSNWTHLRMWWHHYCHSNVGHWQEKLSAPLTLSSSFISVFYFYFSSCPFLVYDQELIIYFSCAMQFCSDFSLFCSKMASTPHKYPGVAGKICNHFLPAKDKSSHWLCSNCHGKIYSADDHCSDCHNWTDEKWEKASVFHEQLAIQWEERKRKVNSSSSSSFLCFSSPSVMPIP